MADLDKVMKGLNCCKNSYPKDCKHCPYEKDCTHDGTCDILIRNASTVIAHQRMEIERLKAQKQKWLQNIADQQLAVSPTGYETEEELAKRTGEWNGLQMAWEILTKE